MEGSIGSKVCRSVRSCWAHRWTRSYRRLAPAPATPRRRPAAAAAVGGGIRLGRRPAAAVARWRFSQLRADARWWWPSSSSSPSPLQLLGRVVGEYLSSVRRRRMMLEEPASSDDDDASSYASAAAASAPTARLRRAASRQYGGRVDGRGVVLNLCVAEALLLRRSSSVTRRSPLRARKAARIERASAR